MPPVLPSSQSALGCAGKFVIGIDPLSSGLLDGTGLDLDLVSRRCQRTGLGLGLGSFVILLVELLF